MSKFILTLFSIAREPAVTEIHFEPVVVVGIRPEPSLKYSDMNFNQNNDSLYVEDFKQNEKSIK